MRFRSKLSSAVAVVALLAVAFAGQVAAPESVRATPVASTPEAYTACGRVFPDPQAFGPSPQAAPGESPYAEGNLPCRSRDFIQYDEMVAGFEFLETIAPEGLRPFAEFMEFQRLDEDYADVLDLASGEGLSEGLPEPDGTRLRSPLYMVKVTDAASDIPEAERDHFAFSLSIHGIERAGAEGGIRAAEDLVTWGATEPDRPLSITDSTRSVSVGEALRSSVIYFLLPNPDGWIRGDTIEQNLFYQRYNGNGIDLNRDWPSSGYTFRPYTPLSESETRSFAKVLQHIKDQTASGSFTGFNDLHGQLIDRAFSFTLIGGATRPFDKNEESIDVLQRIWADQETRLSWSTLIKANSEPESCVPLSATTPLPPEPAEGCDPTNRLYADQFGTIWDTIDYTVTGAFGDWADSPLGLNALGLDNEMSLSHLSNCGSGKCYDGQIEQLHIDGNKGLIYAQINLQLQTQDPAFRQPGSTAYVVNPQRVADAGSDAPGDSASENLPPQDTVSGSLSDGTPFDFAVLGPDDGVYNGGLTAEVTYPNIQGISPSATTAVIVERRRPQEPTPDGDEWEEVNADFNQAPTYLQSGMTVNVNAPLPGEYRVRVEGPVAALPGTVEVAFTTALAWPDPGQIAYDVSNMDFFPHLDGFSLDGHGFTPVTVDEILAGTDLSGFDSIVMADRFMPGWRADLPPAPPAEVGVGPAQEPITGTSDLPAAPGAGTRAPGTSSFFVFEITAGSGNGETTMRVPADGDLDLYLQPQAEDGSFGDDIAASETGDLDGETLTVSRLDNGTYQLEVHNYAATPGPYAVEITFAGAEADEPDEEELEPKLFTDAQRDDYLGRLADWARAGGNLVFTDAALEGLRHLESSAGASAPFAGETAPVTNDEGEVTTPPQPLVRELLVYAGHVEFNDGTAETYATHDLAREVNRPGAAEGANNRHQTAEPVPTGYAIQNAGGGDQNSHPNWVVDQEAWETAGGVTVGTAQGGAGVSLGELAYGAGSVRILGGLLPMPTQESDHPFGLDPYGLTFSGYQVFDNLLQWVAPGGAWRLGGADRFETATEVAYHHWNTIDSVVIASGDSFADALTAVPLAKALDAPILLAPRDGLERHAFDYLLTRNPPPTTAYIVGGDAVLSEQIEADLERVYVPADGIVRLAGDDRFSTAVRVAEEIATVTGTTPTQAVVATGSRFPDALAAGPVAANLGASQVPVPLLLVADGEVPAVVAEYLQATGITETLVAGGPSAVSNDVLVDLPGATRAAGADRYETAAVLADLLADLRGEPTSQVTLATGLNFPDALVVGSAGGRDGIPTLLVHPDGLGSSPATDTFLAEHGADLRTVYLAGGTAVLSDAIAAQVETRTGR